MKKLTILLLVVLICGVYKPAHATLIDNLDGTITQIRSDGSRLMWLMDPTYSWATPGDPLSGLMTWEAAKTWAEQLTFNGYEDWRLPANLPINSPDYDVMWSLDGTTDRGYNITSLNSEMSYLYYVELENSTDAGHALNKGPFDNLEAYYQANNGQHGVYWSGSDPPPNYSTAWFFGFYHGTQKFHIRY